MRDSEVLRQSLVLLRAILVVWLLRVLGLTRQRCYQTQAAGMSRMHTQAHTPLTPDAPAGTRLERPILGTQLGRAGGWGVDPLGCRCTNDTTE